MWKDMLMILFNLIDYNHSGRIKFTLIIIYLTYRIGFISRDEFSDVIKLVLYDENGTGDINEEYVQELTSAMDFDKNGKIDINEFMGKILSSKISGLYFLYILESFRIVNIKTSQNSNDQTTKSQLSNPNIKINSSELNGRVSNEEITI